MNIVYRAPCELKPYDKNAKKHDDVQVANVAESIRQYGFVQPIVIDRNNVVVVGHCRLLASKKLKLRSVRLRGRPHGRAGKGSSDRGQQDQRIPVGFWLFG